MSFTTQQFLKTVGLRTAIGLACIAAATLVSGCTSYSAERAQFESRPTTVQPFVSSFTRAEDTRED